MSSINVAVAHLCSVHITSSLTHTGMRTDPGSELSHVPSNDRLYNPRFTLLHICCCHKSISMFYYCEKFHLHRYKIGEFNVFLWKNKSFQFNIQLISWSSSVCNWGTKQQVNWSLCKDFFNPAGAFQAKVTQFTNPNSQSMSLKADSDVWNELRLFSTWATNEMKAVVFLNYTSKWQNVV